MQILNKVITKGLIELEEKTITLNNKVELKREKEASWLIINNKEKRTRKSKNRVEMRELKGEEDYMVRMMIMMTKKRKLIKGILEVPGEDQI